MFGFLGKLLGSAKAVDAGVRGIDALVFTEQEKSAAKLDFLQNYKPFKLCQRYLALLFSVPYVLGWIIALGFAAGGRPSQDLMALLDGRMGDAVALIVLFYFGGGAIESLKQRFAQGKTAKAIE